jgi:hypothetical protein
MASYCFVWEEKKRTCIHPWWMNVYFYLLGLKRSLSIDLGVGFVWFLSASARDRERRACPALLIRWRKLAKVPVRCNGR